MMAARAVTSTHFGLNGSFEAKFEALAKHGHVFSPPTGFIVLRHFRACEAFRASW
jgi:hypothetical protein